MARKFPPLPSKYTTPDLHLVLQDVEQREARRVEKDRVQLTPVHFSVEETQKATPTLRTVPSQVQLSSVQVQEPVHTAKQVPSKVKFQF